MARGMYLYISLNEKASCANSQRVSRLLHQNLTSDSFWLINMVLSVRSQFLKTIIIETCQFSGNRRLLIGPGILKFIPCQFWFPTIGTGSETYLYPWFMTRISTGPYLLEKILTFAHGSLGTRKARSFNNVCNKVKESPYFSQIDKRMSHCQIL